MFEKDSDKAFPTNRCFLINIGQREINIRC
jgi:hypothetical protein